MTDCHVHFLHNKDRGGEYSEDFLYNFIKTAQSRNIDEIYLLEHTRQFIEFQKIYKPIKGYNEYQKNWITKKMSGSVNEYLNFVKSVKNNNYPVKIKFGLEVCYIPETADKLSCILQSCKRDFDFFTGSVHWINGWGFDHGSQCELWNNIDINQAYKDYYKIMAELIKSGLFTGLAHPDSIKCFGFYPDFDLTETYIKITYLLNKYNMYAENSGGLHLNYKNMELGLNQRFLNILKENNARILTASDAHKYEDVGENIFELQNMIGE